jgi:putative membrane protein insertion efficiency factor
VQFPRLELFVFWIFRMSAEHTTPRGFADVPRLFGRAMVTLYRYTVSPLIGPRCRHLPGCSEYADESITCFGLWAGSWMALARITRCQPWGTSGLDLVPGAVPADAKWWLPWRYGRWRGVNDTPAPR